MKKWQVLILGMVLGIIILFLVITVLAYYNKYKNNLKVITREDATEILEDMASGNEKVCLQNGVLHINAKYFEKFGNDAIGEKLPIKFYQPKLKGDFYEYSIKIKDSLCAERYTTYIYDITDKRHYHPITDLIPINIDSLAQKPIYMKDMYSSIYEEVMSEKIALEVSTNGIVKSTYLSGYQATGICVPIYIKDKPTMVLFIFNRRMTGYLMKTKEGWEGKIGETNFTTKDFEENTIFSDKELNALKKLRKQENRALYYINNDFTIEKGQIYSRTLHIPLLKMAMDTLYPIGDTYNKELIVGEKNKQKYLFNGLLQNITPKGFQAINSGDQFSVLANNQVSYINDLGKLSTTVSEEKKNYFYYVYQIKEDDNDSFRIICKGYNADDLWETYRTVPISKSKFPEGFTFINHKKKISFLEKDMEEKRNYLVAKVNGLWGLYAFTPLITGYYEYARNEESMENIKEIIMNTTLTPILPHEYTKMNANKMTQLVFFEKNGLKGYYPLQKEGRYKEITPFINDAFARFTLPDGRKGWLQCNGKEYFD